MNSDSKIRLLEELRDQIAASIPDSWLFPERGDVKGFLGPGPVMLVAERSSTGHFGGPSDYLLYSLLAKYGVGGAHVTDVIKSRGKVGEPYPTDMSPHRHIFKHVERGSSTCKFWLAPIELARSHGFSAHELNVIRRIIRAQRGKILEVWHEHCR